MLTSKQYHDLLKAKLKRFSRSQEEWKKFLETSSRMYKYGFKESVSIFAQKPNATACAEIKTWKKATNRRVIRTSEAIGLVYSTDNVNVTSIRYVFDISNTVKVNEQSKTPYFWTIDDTCEERVYNELKQAYGVTDAINLEEAIKKIVRERIAYLTKDVQSNIIKSVEGSAAEELDEFALSAVCERFASESATYAILHRCGIEYDADFSDIYNFDTVNAITAVGDIINQTSEEVLRSIEKTMKAILKEEYYERIRETARNDNESDRRRGDNIQTETYLPFSDTKEEKIDIGKYGRMRLKFLREQKPIPMTFNQLMINGELEQHLLTVNEQCISRVSEFVEKNREKYGATDALQNSNPLEWTRICNSLRMMAEEQIQKEIIYAQ